MSTLHAAVGDRYIELPHGAGQRVREGVVVDVHGADGAPPYVVRWSDGTGAETVGENPAALVLHYERAPGRSPR